MFYFTFNSAYSVIYGSNTCAQDVVIFVTCRVSCSRFPRIRANHFPEFFLTCVIKAVTNKIKLCDESSRRKPILNPFYVIMFNIRLSIREKDISYIYRTPSFRDKIVIPVSEFEAWVWKRRIQSTPISLRFTLSCKITPDAP